jgi:uncharacterized repeat protein (TIGR01451 family)
VRMQKFMKSKLTVLTVFTLFCLPVWSEVKVVLTAHKIVKTNGTEQSVLGDKAKPGDVIEYVATYRNIDTKPATNVTATLPIPRGMEYIPNTASPERLMASTDDEHYAVVPLKRMVKDANGKAVEELVPYSEYRSLRWQLGAMPGGTTRDVKARMKVRTGSK